MENAAWVHITISQVVSKASCLLRGVVVSSDFRDDIGYVKLYNGESINDPEICGIRTLTGETKQLIFDTPLVCDRGLYVLLVENVNDCLVQYELLSK